MLADRNEATFTTTTSTTTAVAASTTTGMIQPEGQKAMRVTRCRPTDRQPGGFKKKSGGSSMAFRRGKNASVNAAGLPPYCVSLTICLAAWLCPPRAEHMLRSGGLAPATLFGLPCFSYGRRETCSLTIRTHIRSRAHAGNLKSALLAVRTRQARLPAKLCCGLRALYSFKKATCSRIRPVNISARRGHCTCRRTL